MGPAEGMTRARAARAGSAPTLTVASRHLSGVLVSQVAARSVPGGRDSNEDRVIVLPELVVLADGMGGHEGGELAAHAAVSAASAALLPPVTEPVVRVAFEDAGAAVHQVRHRQPRLVEAGCTLTVVALRPMVVAGSVRGLVAHVGDSPAFLVRRGQLQLLTQAHTVAAELVRSGRLTEDESQTHPGQHTLTRSVGVMGRQGPEIRELELEPGDRILVASDGITAGPDRREVRRLACAPGPVDEVIAELADYLDATSSDNATVALLDPWDEPDAATASHDG